jgi:hypothetical protein
MRMVKFISISAVAVACALSLGMAEAATLNITGVTGQWTFVQTTATTSNLSGLGSSAISWGTPVGPAGQSGYSFTGHAPSGSLMQEAVFDVGTLTHQNQPIAAGTSVLGATLTVTFDLLIEGTTAQIVSLFDFGHFETPNEANPCADGGPYGVGVNSAGCADRVTARTNLASSEAYVVDGIAYFFDVTGFLTDGTPMTAFWTTEGRRNTAILQARFTAKPTDLPAPVPLPATGLLMIAGMGTLAAFRARRQDRSHQRRSHRDVPRPRIAGSVRRTQQFLFG